MNPKNSCKCLAGKDKRVNTVEIKKDLLLKNPNNKSQVNKRSLPFLRREGFVQKSTGHVNTSNKIKKIVGEGIKNTHKYLNERNNILISNILNQVKSNHPEVILKDIKISLKSKISPKAAFSADCANQIIITQADLPYVITQPGYYKVCGDLSYIPVGGPFGNGEFTAAITIIPVTGNLLENVTLDFNGFTLSQGDLTPNVYGVLFGPGFFWFADPINPSQDITISNVTIKNGTITQFSAIGVFGFNNTFGDIFGNPPTTNLPFDNLQFSDLNIFRCGTDGSGYDGSGIDLTSLAVIGSSGIIQETDPVSYTNIVIKNCKLNNCRGQSAITIFTYDNVVIRNTQANGLTTTQNIFLSCFAYYLIGRNLQMFKCYGNKVSDLDPLALGGQCGGINCNSGSNVYLENCQFNSTFGLSDVIVNNNLSLLINAIFVNCQFNNNSGGISVVTVAGVHASDNMDQTGHGSGYKFLNCQFNGTSISPDNTERGFL